MSSPVSSLSKGVPVTKSTSRTLPGNLFFFLPSNQPDMREEAEERRFVGKRKQRRDIVDLCGGKKLDLFWKRDTRHQWLSTLSTLPKLATLSFAQLSCARLGREERRRPGWCFSGFDIGGSFVGYVFLLACTCIGDERWRETSSFLLHFFPLERRGGGCYQRPSSCEMYSY
ncbi:hypothetical protein T439DRAFT_249374 [Meredithblackwellia eburnea MCA 4105]